MDIRCDVCHALVREVFVQSSEATRGGTVKTSEEDVYDLAYSACQGQVPPLLHRYSVVPRPNADAELLDRDLAGATGSRARAGTGTGTGTQAVRRAERYVLGERNGYTTLTNFEASAFKKACSVGAPMQADLGFRV